MAPGEERISETEIRDETVIALLQERGYTVTKEGDEADLAAKVADLEARLSEVGAALETAGQSLSPDEQFARELLDALERSRTSRWVGGSSGA